MKSFNKYFDHTLLNANATSEQIAKVCREALEYDFASVCINGCHVLPVSKFLSGSNVKVAAVAGFPLGASSSASKAAEVTDALKNGADEIDVVINIGAAKDRRDEYIYEELHLLANICHDKDAVLKAILETCLLTDEEIVRLCQIAEKSNADFVKTSTGFSAGGATAEHVRLMKTTVGKRLGVKASGGIRTLDDALKMIDAGANRLGCSASCDIMKEYLISRQKA